MNAVYLMNQIHYEHKKLLLVTSKRIVTSQVTNCNVFCTVVCAIPMASLEIKALKKATRDVDKQMIQSRVYGLQRGYCPDADSLGQWRKSYHDIVTKKNPVVIHLIPHQPVVLTGLPRWCLLTQ